jgi:hypothetical protein
MIEVTYEHHGGTDLQQLTLLVLVLTRGVMNSQIKILI